MSRNYDLVLFGATGFTGQQAATLIAREMPDLRWAVAGRNEAKLRALADSLPVSVDVVVADGSSAAEMSALAVSTRVVCSTAGPFALYSDALVAACVLHQTHYCDITGETPWVRRLIDAHHEKASAEGTRIVPMCGYDSVPSDLGAFLVARALQQAGESCEDTRASMTIKGGLNGGTLASALAMSEREGPAAFVDGILLHPPELRTEAERKRHRDDRSIRWDPELEVYTAPFVMAAVNTRVVRRSAALLHQRGEGYGEAFTYNEFLGTRSRASAYSMAAGLAGLGLLLAGPPGRWLLRTFGPAPGEGPSEEVLDGGFTRAVHLARGSGGSSARAVLTYAGDPGNRATLRFLVSCTRLLCGLGEDRSLGGILTPASAFGQALVDDLRAHEVSWKVAVNGANIA